MVRLSRSRSACTPDSQAACRSYSTPMSAIWSAVSDTARATRSQCACSCSSDSMNPALLPASAALPPLWALLAGAGAGGAGGPGMAASPWAAGGALSASCSHAGAWSPLSSLNSVDMPDCVGVGSSASASIGSSCGEGGPGSPCSNCDSALAALSMLRAGAVSWSGSAPKGLHATVLGGGTGSAAQPSGLGLAGGAASGVAADTCDTSRATSSCCLGPSSAMQRVNSRR
mmetsp:Transcript_5223/g.12862  ORF Transcript_5223/g.12862 Transcript_5223/m.12862 type:complete len:229 (-) Transcript_5223:272-958(-)